MRLTLLQMPEDGFVRLPDILRFLGISRATWWRGIKAGTYPKGFKLGPRITVWNAKDIWSIYYKMVNEQRSRAFAYESLAD